ncbi:MAG: S49 family peptidase, partial [Chloroflexi bacterium]|nr:S49 family peptidase [Chloroflexota bacterium]
MKRIFIVVGEQVVGRVATLARLWPRWYVSSALLAGIGIFIGYLILVIFLPGRPQIGVIDISGLVIDRGSVARISAMLDYVRDNDDIKAVVIKMDSPGGDASGSENLFLKTLDLRSDKPVVVSVQGIAASGAYMWSMGSNFIYVNPTSFVGSVGVILQLGAPPPLDENLIFSGPAKLTGAPFRTFVAMMEAVKDNFVSIVVTQRGDRLKISREVLSEAQLYLGSDAVRLGLADAIGSDNDAIKKAASLAGISGYTLIDVNAKVDRLRIERNRRIIASLLTDEEQGDSISQRKA